MRPKYTITIKTDSIPLRSHRSLLRFLLQLNHATKHTFTGLAMVISMLCVPPLNPRCPSIIPMPFIEMIPIGTLFTGFPDTAEIFIDIIGLICIGTLIFIPAVGVSTSRDDIIDGCGEELI